MEVNEGLSSEVNRRSSKVVNVLFFSTRRAVPAKPWSGPVKRRCDGDEALKNILIDGS